MTVEFYEDKKQEHRWHILEDDEDSPVHACHEGFSSKHNALHNLFINHAMMNIFVASVARGSEEEGARTNISFEKGNDKKVRWKIRADNGELVGQAHKGFDDTFEAMDNLIITYTMLTVFVAQVAQSRSAEHNDGG